MVAQPEDDGTPGEPPATGTPEFETIAHALLHWCEVQPAKVMYRWLDDEGVESVAWTYRDVLRRANAVANLLRGAPVGLEPGDRAACMYLPGLDFIAAFWGCLLAGVIAVPVYPVDIRNAKVQIVALAPPGCL